MTNTTPTATESAASLRAAIKVAVRAGTLPSATYSVRTRYASMMSAIDVKVTDLPFCAYAIDDWINNFGMRSVHMTDEAQRVNDVIQGMAGEAGYCADGRHSFLTIDIDHEERSALFSFTNMERNGEIARALIA